MKSILLIFFILISDSGFSQCFSKSGKYVFSICDKSQEQNNPVLILLSTNGSWRKEIWGARQGLFAGEGDLFIYLLKNEIHLVDLKAKGDKIIAEGRSIDMNFSKDGKWIKFNSVKGELCFYNL